MLLVFSNHPVSQVKEELATPEGVKRKSNSGHRKLDVDDQILLFLNRLRRRTPYEGLSVLFGVSVGTASNTFTELLLVFHAHLVPRLLDPLSGDQIDAMMPAECKEDLPGARLIVDLTGFPCKGKENVLLGRVLYSAYHHGSEMASVFGMLGLRESIAQPAAHSPTTLAQ